MNGAHFHLALNHFPLVGFFFSIVLLAIGWMRGKDDFVTAALLVIVISGAFAIPTYLTGEPAEKVLEKFPGFSESRVEEHEEAAEWAIWFIAATSLAAGAGLWLSMKKKALPKLALATILVLNVFSVAIVARTALLGGKISHREIRDPSAQPADPVKDQY